MVLPLVVPSSIERCKRSLTSPPLENERPCPKTIPICASVVRIEALERGHQARDVLVTQRVVLLRSIEGDVRDLLANLVTDGHALLRPPLPTLHPSFLSRAPYEAQRGSGESSRWCPSRVDVRWSHAAGSAAITKALPPQTVRTSRSAIHEHRIAVPALGEMSFPTRRSASPRDTASGGLAIQPRPLDPRSFVWAPRAGRRDFFGAPTHAIGAATPTSHPRPCRGGQPAERER